MIKAIDTIYMGRRYRSRLEARWAVFFRHMGLPVEYEHDGLVLDGEPYLPDFFAVDTGVYLEIKPRFVLVNNAPELIRARIRQSLMSAGGAHILNVFGNPMASEHSVETPFSADDHWSFAQCRECGGLCLACESCGWTEWPHKCAHDGDKWPAPDGDRLLSAYSAAMQERFERQTKGPPCPPAT